MFGLYYEANTGYACIDDIYDAQGNEMQKRMLILILVRLVLQAIELVVALTMMAIITLADLYPCVLHKEWKANW